MTRILVNGVHLNVERSGTGPSLLLLHGFSGSHATWTPFIHAWPNFSLIAVDLLGHGHSDAPAEASRYRMECCVDDLVAVLDMLEIQHCAVLGYSMGGRVAMRLALCAPERVRALILESASPGIDPQAERTARMKSDASLAEAIERDGIAAFVDRWQALPLFASQARLPATIQAALRRQRLQNDPHGLAGSLRELGAGRQGPVLDHLSTLRIPVLLLAGGLDPKYCERAGRMAAQFSCRRLEIVQAAGHAVHLENPLAFASLVREFLREFQQKYSERALA